MDLVIEIGSRFGYESERWLFKEMDALQSHHYVHAQHVAMMMMRSDDPMRTIEFRLRLTGRIVFEDSSSMQIPVKFPQLQVALREFAEKNRDLLAEITFIGRREIPGAMRAKKP
jgi:hypothetical protein